MVIDISKEISTFIVGRIGDSCHHESHTCGFLSQECTIEFVVFFALLVLDESVGDCLLREGEKWTRCLHDSYTREETESYNFGELHILVDNWYDFLLSIAWFA